MSFVDAVGSSDIGAMDMLAADGRNSQKEPVKEMFSQLIQDKKEEYLVKIQNGSSEPSFPIGAGSYTEKEWKKLLKDFDAAEEQIRKEIEETKKEAEEAKDKESREKNVEMLLAGFSDSLVLTESV